MATSDSLPGFVPALSGITLIRFPTSRSRLRWTDQGLPGCVDALSLPATALYTRPGGPDSLSLPSGPWQASPPRDRLAPRKDPAELAYSLVDMTML
jgi:hypothetical protein